MFKSKKKRAENLMEIGQKAVGTITNVIDTGMTVNQNPRVKMVFRIEPLDGSAAFMAEKTKTVSRVQIPQAGGRYPVLYDPENTSEFLYIVSDGGAQARQQVVAMFGDAFGADGSGVGMAGVPAPAPAAPAAPELDPIERIAKLDELRRSGALTEEEFAAQKARVLGIS